MINNSEDEILVWGTSTDSQNMSNEDIESKMTDEDSPVEKTELMSQEISVEHLFESEGELAENSINAKSDDCDYEKKYYKISEVESMIGETQSTIRFWEDAFAELGKNYCSQRSRSGTRKYTKENIENLKLLKLLLRERHLTIEGAISEIKTDKRRNSKERALILLMETRDELNNLIDAYNCILHQNC